MPPSSRPLAWLVLMMRLRRVRCFRMKGCRSGSAEEGDATGGSSFRMCRDTSLPRLVPAERAGDRLGGAARGVGAHGAGPAGADPAEHQIDEAGDVLLLGGDL